MVEATKAPAIKLDGVAEKKLKAVIKEGGKKAQDVAGVADLGGLDFFCTSMMESAGNIDQLRAQMDAMNAECDPESEERRGGAGHVGKMLISSEEKTAVAMVCYVPEDKISKLTAAEWIEYVAKQVQAEVLFASPGYAYAVMKYDKEAGRFPLKEKDNAISHSTLILRQKGFMPDDSDSDDDYVFGDDDFPSEETEAAAPVVAAPPAINLEGVAEKKLKAVIKEGGKKAQDVAGVADLGGLDFFCTSMMESAGNVDQLRAQMDAMNAECDPESEERRGGAGHVGKMLISSSEKIAVALVCYVPEDKQAKLTAKEWIEYVCEQIKAEVIYSSAGYAYAIMKYDPPAGRFPLKEKDTAISHSTLILRQKGFMPDDDSDDDEMVFGDDDFPEF